MDFGFSTENEGLRADVQQFIRDHTSPELLQELKDNRDGQTGPLVEQLRRNVAEKGWLAMSWPREYGGLDASRIDQFIVEEEFVRANIGVGLSATFEQAGAIMAAGTEEQKRYFLPRMLTGEVSFAMGYTEPNAGTDLASLETRAEEDGDEYLINGQKMYCSAAHYASHVYLMTRTDPDLPKHRGISIFLVPMDTPGISHTPLWTLPGGRTNMLYLDNVRVPRDAMLGERNRGWYVGAAALNLGRGGAYRYYEYVEELERLVHYVKTHTFGGRSLAADPEIRECLAELYCEAQVCRLFLWRNISYELRGVNPPYEISSQKIWGSEFWVKSSQRITQILGPYAQLTDGSDLAPEEGWFVKKYLGAARGTFAHGGVQVLRNQIAKRGLGLPAAPG
jgi:alkylation response protein AidB-like acyl-CoA dehydrogenase